MVLPQEELGAGAKFMRQTALQLRLLAKMVDQIRVASTDLEASTTGFSDQVSKLTSSVQSPAQLLQSTRNHILDTRQALHSVSLPLHASLAGMALGGLYIFLGIFSFVLSGIYEGIVQGRQSVILNQKLPIQKERAA